MHIHVVIVETQVNVVNTSGDSANTNTSGYSANTDESPTQMHVVIVETQVVRNTSGDGSPKQMHTCGDSASTSGDSEAAKVVTDFCSLLATALSKVSLPDNAAPN